MASKGQKRKVITLDPEARSPQAHGFESGLQARVIGQERAVRSISSLYQVFHAGMTNPSRPLGTMLFLGPTGSGKTHVVEAAADLLFNDRNAVIKIDCAEFQHSHEIAKIIGSPPGYLGHRETSPLLSQENLDKYRTEKDPFTLVLFDEIEKASDALWQLLLGVLDKGTLTLGDNRKVDFRFSPEFMNRIDKVVVFRSLQKAQLDSILDLELKAVQQRIDEGAGETFTFTVSDEAKQFLLAEGIEYRYGARHLKRAIERFLVYPLANLSATHQVRLGDVVLVDIDAETQKLTFFRDDAVETKAAAAIEAIQAFESNGENRIAA